MNESYGLANARRLARTHSQTMATATGLRRAILHLHRPYDCALFHDVKCQGCDAGSYSEEPPDWPCTTYLVALVIL